MSQDVPIGRSQISLAQLNERSREIFRQIVESYLTTGEPLGSRNLSRLITTPLSPASVRNVMADLEQLGLIYAPHTSAGRLPTELGLRFFVDALMQIGDLNESERRQIESQVAGAGKSVENVLTEATGLLSGLTHSAGVVLTAKSNVRLKNIEFVRLEPERALIVLVGEDGQVENRVVNLPIGLPTSALIEAGNFLNARIRGKRRRHWRAIGHRDDIESRHERLNNSSPQPTAAARHDHDRPAAPRRNRGHRNCGFRAKPLLVKREPGCDLGRGQRRTLIHDDDTQLTRACEPIPGRDLTAHDDSRRNLKRRRESGLNGS